MHNKLTFIKRVLTQLMVLTLLFTPSIASATDVIIVDPTPDTTPPVLTSLSISSNQASPGNPVKITAGVSDELSGVNRVYISYRKPSGNNTGTYLYLNQTTQKYEGTISIGTYDEAGEWIPNYLTLTDNKDNNGNVYDDNNNSSGQKFDLDLYKFTVSEVSTPPVTPEPTDKVPPVLNSISITTSLVSGPGTVKLIADVSDDDTGVNTVWVNYLKPSGRSYYVNLYFNSTSSKYEGIITIDQYDEIGDWKLNYVRLGDKAGNYRYINDSSLNPNSLEKQDFSSCKIHVEGITPDLIAPSLDDLGLTLIQNSNNTALIKLFADVSDELSGVNTSSVYAVYSKPSGKTITVRFSRNVTTGKYEASIPIDRYDELNTWKLNYINVSDNKSNYRTIKDKLGTKSLNEWDFGPYYFTVRGVITIPPAVPSSIGLSIKAITMKPGETQQLKVTLKMSDTSYKDITAASSGTLYTSSRPEEVRVDENGHIIVSSNAKPGTVTIQASNSSLSEQCEITIPGAENKSYIIVNPLRVSLSTGQTKQLNVVAKLSDGTTNDVTDDTETTYTSSNTSVVNVTNKGLISIPSDAKPGIVKISINYNGIIAETTVTFTGPPTIKSTSMTPKTTEIIYGEKIQLSIRATMSDGTTKDVTDGSTGTIYTSSDSTRALVDENGLVSIPEDARSGQVTIRAINNNLIAESNITVNGVPELTGIQINPNSLTLKPGDTNILHVLASYSDGSTKDINLNSEGTTYTSSNTARVYVDSEGNITIPDSATPGSATVTAKNGTFHTSTVITVEKDLSKEIKSLSVIPGTLTLNFGETKQLTIMATMGDGSLKDVTASSEGTVFTSSAASRATVDAEGKITIPRGSTAGTVTITAKNGLFTSSAVITVQKNLSKEVKSIAETPGTITLNFGDVKQLAVMATMGDGCLKDVTASSEGTVYTSSSTGRALVDAEGKITIPSSATAGTVTITAKNGMFTSSAVITVQKDLSKEVKSIAITPGTMTLNFGDFKQLTVMATMGDGSLKDVTASSEGTVYTSSSTVRATVDAEGKITIPSSATAGTVTITAKNGMFTSSAVITVQKDLSKEVKSIAITPGTMTLNFGDTGQLLVMATMGDGSLKDVTASSEGTVYTSSAPTRASVDTEGEIIIPITSIAGTVTITAKNGTLTKTTVITIVK